MSYLVTLITKAIDITFNGYQPVWLRYWRGDISRFFLQKTSFVLVSRSYLECIFMNTFSDCIGREQIYIAYYS